MRIGVVIVMYDEIDLVWTSINNIKSKFNDAKIVVVQSFSDIQSENLKKIKETSDKFILLPNLANTYNRFELPSQAICRNISKGITALYELGDFDCITISTGDTLINDPESFSRRYQDMQNNKWIGMVSKAIDQSFHAPTDNPPEGLAGNRYQHQNTTDFACCFFILDGKFAKETNAFSNIEITNRWTSEQCLGDEMIKAINGNKFNEKIGVLNNAFPFIPYSYNDGITYHAKTNGMPSR